MQEKYKFKYLQVYTGLSRGVKITPSNKIDKPTVVNRFTGNVLTSIMVNVVYIMANYNVFTAEMRFQSNLNYIL